MHLYVPHEILCNESVTNQKAVAPTWPLAHEARSRRYWAGPVFGGKQLRPLPPAPPKPFILHYSKNIRVDSCKTTP